MKLRCLRGMNRITSSHRAFHHRRRRLCRARRLRRSMKRRILKAIPLDPILSPDWFRRNDHMRTAGTTRTTRSLPRRERSTRRRRLVDGISLERLLKHHRIKISFTLASPFFVQKGACLAFHWRMYEHSLSFGISHGCLFSDSLQYRSMARFSISLSENSRSVYDRCFLFSGDHEKRRRAVASAGAG